MMKEDRSDVVKVAIEGEKTSPSLVRPYLNFVVVTSRCKQRLSFVEIYASHWTVVLFESVNERSHAIIP